MSAHEQRRPNNRQSAPPSQPDYPDEISQQQLNTIRQLADPDGEHAAGRVLLYPDPW